MAMPLNFAAAMDTLTDLESLPAPGDHASALALCAALSARAARHGVALRPPPPEPTTCCGRGCNGCVWEGYYDAMAFWRDDALDAMAAATSIPTC